MRHPNDSALADAQECMRGLVPELTNDQGDDVHKGLPEDGEKASEHLRAVLHAAGHPRANDAFVIRHQDPAARKSQVVMDPETRAPGVALHPDRWDWGTLAHEAGHILQAHADGREIDQLPTPEQKHGPEFLHHYSEALWRLPISYDSRLRAGVELRAAYRRAQKRLAANSDVFQFKPRSAFAEPPEHTVGGNTDPVVPFRHETLDCAVSQARNARASAEQYAAERDAAVGAAEERLRRDEREEQERGQAVPNGIGADRLGIGSVSPCSPAIDRDNELGG